MPKRAHADTLAQTPTNEFDQLALINEVMGKRQEELEDLRIQISNVRHGIQQERIQWDEQRRQEENALKLRSLKLEQAVAEKFAQADQLVTARLDAFQQAETERQAAVKERTLLQQDRRLLGHLNQERIEVERLRLEVTRRHEESARQWSEAQAALNTANQRHEATTKLLDEIERRTATLDQLRNHLDAQQADYALHAKHLNRVQEAIGQVIEKLPVPETPALPAPSLPEPISPWPMPAPGIQEFAPSAAVDEPLPSLPPLAGLNGDVEIAPRATESIVRSASEPAVVSTPMPTMPYVHPSQRRVLDASKPLNDQ